MTGSKHGAVADEEGVHASRVLLSEPPVPWWQRHALLIDAVTVGVVFAYNLMVIGAFTGAGRGWVANAALVVISVVLCGAYVVRRQYPFRAFAVMIVVAFAQLLLNVGVMVVDLLFVFMVFFLASRFRWTKSAPAAVVVMVWLAIALSQMFDDGLRVGYGAMTQFLVGVVVLWLAGTIVRVRRDYTESLRERARELEQQRDTQAQIAAAEERTRIAREIHDVVSHSLSVVVFMTDGALSRVRTEPARAEEALVTARDTGRQAMTEMRRMVGVLRTSEAALLGPQPGVGRLQVLVDESRAAGLPAELSVSDEPVPLSEGLDLCVYRVVQEGLTNAREHGGPTLSRVDVHLEYTNAELAVTIADDGAGPRMWLPDGAGHGLVGMRERVALYGGDVRTGVRKGGGFDLTVTLPLSGGAE